MQRTQTLLVGKWGFGVAVCTRLRRLVAPDWVKHALCIFEIQLDGSLVELFSVGSRGDGPLQFGFCDNAWGSGWMCFTAGPARPTLLVTDAGNDRVQEVDVLAPAHVGFPINVPGPRGVAASLSLLAVSAWEVAYMGDHLVRVFDAVTRTPVFVLGHGCGDGDGQLMCPRGLRLSRGG